MARDNVELEMKVSPFAHFALVFYDFVPGKVAKMGVPKAAYSRMVILKHNEIPMETNIYLSEKTKPNNNRCWCWCWCNREVSNKIYI